MNLQLPKHSHFLSLLLWVYRESLEPTWRKQLEEWDFRTWTVFTSTVSRWMLLPLSREHEKYCTWINVKHSLVFVQYCQVNVKYCTTLCLPLLSRFRLWRMKSVLYCSTRNNEYETILRSSVQSWVMTASQNLIVLNFRWHTPSTKTNTAPVVKICRIFWINWGPIVSANTAE